MVFCIGSAVPLLAKNSAEPFVLAMACKNGAPQLCFRCLGGFEFRSSIQRLAGALSAKVCWLRCSSASGAGSGLIMDGEVSQSSIPIRPSQCINVPMFNCVAGWRLCQSAAIAGACTRKRYMFG